MKTSNNTPADPSETNSSNQEKILIEPGEAKQEWYKNKKTQLLSVISFAMILGLTLFVHDSYQENYSNMSQPTTNETALTQNDSASEQNKLLEANVLPGLRFTTPEAWSYVTNLGYRFQEHILLSPDATNSYTGYIPTASGVRLRISAEKRDSEKETGVENPVDAYVSGVGAPRIRDDTVDYYAQKIDKNAFRTFANKSGIEFTSYDWTYEGCFLHILFLSDVYAYSIMVNEGGGCPSSDIVEKNSTISDFIESIQFADDDFTIRADVSVIIKSSGESSEPVQVQVQAKNVAFKFDQIYKKHGLTMLLAGNRRFIPKSTNQGNFGELQIGANEETVREALSETNFLIETYGTTVSFTDSDINYTDLSEVKNNIYGASKNVASIQEEAFAKKYTYYKITDEGTFIVNFFVEAKDSNDLPALNGDYIIQGLESITIL